MGRISEVVIEEVRSRVDLADLIESYGVSLKGAGSTKKACCPFHHEKTPSFAVNETKGFYHCFGCGESGDAIKFLMKMDGLTFIEAVKRLAEKVGVVVEEEKSDPEAFRRARLYALMAELAQFYHRCLQKMKEAQSARDYLVSRALDEAVQESFLIGYAPMGIAPILKWAEKYGYTADELALAGVIKPPQGARGSGYHRFGGRLMFSIRDKQGRVVAFSGRQLVASKNSGKYVNSPETPIFRKSAVLFGFDKAAGGIAKDAHHEALVCEGQIDTIRLHISGFPIAVASQGTAFTEEHVRLLRKVSDQVTLVFDDDAAGHKATIRTARLFLADGMPVRVVRLPDGDDPDSYLRKHAPEDFRRLLDGAESIMAFQVRIERDKEAKPDSIDAIARITRAVLATIAQADSAVIRAGMVGEAAKLLNLPTVALEEELSKVRSRKRPASPGTTPGDEEVAEDADDSVSSPQVASTGERACETLPPSPHEIALCAFLLANEYNAALDALLGETLPPRVLGHAFTQRFVEVWRDEVVRGSDLMGAFAEGLSPRERAWFDEVLREGSRVQASSLSVEAMAQGLIRTLWADSLARERGEMSASGVSADDERRMQLTIDLKFLEMADWAAIRKRIGEWTGEGS